MSSMVNAAQRDWVVEAGWALVPKADGQELVRDVSIVVRDGVITEVRDGWVSDAPSRIDARNLLVTPGFISGHSHAGRSSPARGLIEGGRFMDRPVAQLEKFDDEQLDQMVAYNLAEIIRTGCTTVVEMCGSIRQAESFVRVASEWGVRAFVGITVPNSARIYDVWYRTDDDVLFDSIPSTVREIEIAHEFGSDLRKSPGLVEPFIAAHAADTHTPETLRAVIDAAVDLDTGIQLHVAQRIREVEAVERLWGTGPIPWLESLGVFEQPVIAAHLYKMDAARDLPILRKSGVTYAHCAPMASLLHQASQPYPEALAAGLNIALGLDQLSNDFVENIKLATLNGQLRTSLVAAESAVPLQKPTVADSVRAATIGGATALRRKDLGRLAAGAQADLTAIDVSGLLVGTGALPPDPLNNLLYANGLAVRHVMTSGRLLVRDGQLEVADLDRLISQGAELSRTIWANLDAERWFTAPPLANSRG